MQPTNVPLSAVPAVPDQWAQFGIVGVVAFLFLTAIIILWRRSEKRDEDHAKERVDIEKKRGEDDKAFALEREGWKMERVQLALAYERQLREAGEKHAIDLRSERESHAAILRTEREQNRAHEDLVRKEFTELMDRVSAQQVESSNKLVELLGRFYDRFIGPSAR